MEKEWKRLEKHEQPMIAERADSWLSRVNVGQAASDIIRVLYELLGSTSIYSDRTPLDRALRDAETCCQHIVLQRKTLEIAGATLLEAGRSVGAANPVALAQSESKSEKNSKEIRNGLRASRLSLRTWATACDHQTL